MVRKGREAAWTCVVALLCATGVSLAEPPAFTVEGTWGCYLYLMKLAGGGQAFTTPTSCADWGTNAGTTGTACEGKLVKTSPPGDGSPCADPKVGINESYRYDFVLSFDEFGNLANAGSRLSSTEVLHSGKLTINSTGQFTSTDLAAAPPVYGQSYITTTIESTGEQRGYLVADNDANSEPEANDGCMNQDLRQFSNIKVASYIQSTAQTGEEMFLYCYKTSNDVEGSDGGSGPAGGCFISSRSR